MKLYQVELGNITAGLVVEDGRVAAAAPVLQWSVGLSLAKVKAWVEKKGGMVRCVQERGETRWPKEVTK